MTSVLFPSLLLVYIINDLQVQLEFDIV